MDSPAPAESFHDVLVHYTDAQGLEGILRSNTLWATHWEHTNDAEELQTGLKLLEQFKKTKFWEDPAFRTADFFDLDKLKEKEDAVGAENFWRDEINNIKQTIIDSSFKLKKYICSFSGTNSKNEPYIQENGRLSQWRAYGNYGIVFQKKALDATKDSILNTDHRLSYMLDLKTVDYASANENIQHGTPLYCILRDNIKTFIQHYLSQEHNNNSFAGIDVCFKIIFIFKNKGFEEEKEHRLYIAYFPNDNMKPYEEITLRRNRIVPYTNLFCPRDANGDPIPLPIEKILIGPAHPGEQEERKKTVEALLRHLGKEHIDVHCSKIPYRG